MSEEGQEKQYKPSQRRLDELKKKGTFLRSKDLSSGITLIISILIIVLMAGTFYGVLSDNFILSFTEFGQADVFLKQPASLYEKLALSNFLLLLPLLFILLLCSFLLTFMFGGFGFSMSLVTIKIERINPLKNIKKIISFSNLIEIIKSLFKFSLLSSFLVLFIIGKSDDLLNLTNLDHANLSLNGFGLLKTYLFFVMLGVLIIMMVDMLYSYFSYHNKVKMSFQEVKDEHKETDGNPDNKRRLRSAQLAISRQRLHHDVPSATVIITNPTHYSVALRYNETMDNAPKIVALGIDHLAAEIRLIAIKNAIPIYEAPQLARAIYYTGEVGGYIHQDLYMAVAIVLSYIVQLKHYQMGLGNMPEYVQDLTIPKEFHFEK